MKNYLLIVEGVHDVAALAKYFRLQGYQPIEKIKEVLELWKNQIPRNFPHNEKLTEPVPVPRFFKNDENLIAIYRADGDSNIVRKIGDTLLNLSSKEITALAIFCDADLEPARNRYEKLIEHLSSRLERELLPFIKETVFGTVVENAVCKFGIYVFPNNETSGVLEDLLLEGAQDSYEKIKAHAETYLKAVEEENLDYLDSKNLVNSKRKKVLVGVIANLLKPGRANQNSIEDNDWINNSLLEKDDTYQNKFKQFLEDLLT